MPSPQIVAVGQVGAVDRHGNKHNPPVQVGVSESKAASGLKLQSALVTHVCTQRRLFPAAVPGNRRHAAPVNVADRQSASTVQALN